MKMNSKCSVVLVAGAALRDFHAVKVFINNIIAYDLGKMPYLLVLLVEDPKLVLNMASNLDFPPMVKYQFLLNNICLFSHSCYPAQTALPNCLGS